MYFSACTKQSKHRRHVVEQGDRHATRLANTTDTDTATHPDDATNGYGAVESLTAAKWTCPSAITMKLTSRT